MVSIITTVEESVIQQKRNVIYGTYIYFKKYNFFKIIQVTICQVLSQPDTGSCHRACNINNRKCLKVRH